MPFLSPLPRSHVAVRARLSVLPDAPGVYQFHDRAGRLLYVGKSICLRTRVRSYFGAAAGRSRKLRRLRSLVRGVEWTETGSELAALLLESHLVKQRHPPFNALLHRHRHLVFLRLDLTDPFPRLEVTEELERDGARYFGPLVLTADAERLADILSDTLRLRTCDPPGRRISAIAPCLRRDLSLCHAPCASTAAAAPYAAAVLAAAQAFDREGRPFRERLRAEMADAAERLLFERAARLRDALKCLEELSGRQQALLSTVKSLDLVAACPSHTPANVELFLFRSGGLVVQQSISRLYLQDPEGALSTARDLLGRRRALMDGVRQATETSGGIRSTERRAVSDPPSVAVEREVRDQLFIISRWLRRNSGEGRHFHLPAGEEPDLLAIRLGTWLGEVAAECSEAPRTAPDPASIERELVAEWAEELKDRDS